MIVIINKKVILHENILKKYIRQDNKKLYTIIVYRFFSKKRQLKIKNDMWQKVKHTLKICIKN